MAKVPRSCEFGGCPWRAPSRCPAGVGPHDRRVEARQVEDRRHLDRVQWASIRALG